MNPLLQVEDLTKHFYMGRGQQVHAVDNMSLTINEREIVGLVGESGSGKSTFGKTVVGLHDKTGGTVTYRGNLLPQQYSAKDFQRHARQMQMIFQDPYSSLNPRMTVGAMLREVLKVHRLAPKGPARSRRVGELLEIVGLRPEDADRYPHEFSGGQRQRIGIARALSVEPDFIVCDEPVSALDVSVQAQVINLLRNLQKEFGLTYLFIAHDLAVVEHVSDHVAVMYLGKIVEWGTAEDLYGSPQHPYTKALLSAVPRPDPKAARARQRIVLSGDVPSPMNPPSGCPFHPRCPHPEKDEECRRAFPPLEEKRTGHYAACIKGVMP